MSADLLIHVPTEADKVAMVRAVFGATGLADINGFDLAASVRDITQRAGVYIEHPYVSVNWEGRHLNLDWHHVGHMPYEQPRYSLVNSPAHLVSRLMRLRP